MGCNISVQDNWAGLVGEIPFEELNLYRELPSRWDFPSGFILANGFGRIWDIPFRHYTGWRVTGRFELADVNVKVLSCTSVCVCTFIPYTFGSGLGEQLACVYTYLAW